MAKISFVHLSDFHYDKDIAKDMKIVVEALSNDLKAVSQEHNIKPTFVVFSGDLVQAGHVAEDFETAYDLLMEALRKGLELEPKRFFFSPGNHDIDKEEVDENLDAGLKHNCETPHHVNRVIDRFSDRPYYLNRLKPFNQFVESRASTEFRIKSGLFSAYRFDDGNAKIGLCCLNSCWQATGKKGEDSGKLFLGERQVDDAVNAVKDCELRIAAVHHPFEWLSEVERSRVRKRLLDAFDILLLGHNHESSPERIEVGEVAAVMSKCGCLYHSRNYWNGYTIISCDLDAKKANFFIRTYFDDPRRFDKALNVINDGTWSFDLKTHEKSFATAGRSSVPICPESSPDEGRQKVTRLISLKTALNADGRLEVFGMGNSGALWHIWQDPREPSGWSNWESLEGQTIEMLEVVLNGDGLLEIFGRGPDKCLWHISQDSRTYTGWGIWDSLQGKIESFRVALNISGRLEIFAKGEGGALWHKWQVPGGWSQWTSMGGEIEIFEVGRNADGRLEIFSQWKDQQRYHIWQIRDSEWSAWHKLGQ